MLVILKEKYHRNFGVFGQSHFTIPLLIYKVILKHQESEINQFLKEGQILFFVASDDRSSTGTSTAALRSREATTKVDFGDFHEEESILHT